MNKHILMLAKQSGLIKYDSDGKDGFKDYDIYHSDLVVKIDDTDATFYEHEDGRMILDHSPETLGIKNE